MYVFRTRRPGLVGRLPWWFGLAAVALSAAGISVSGGSLWFSLLGLLASPRHFAYVGESRRVGLRRRDHLQGSVKYNQPPKPWSDLDPSWYYVPLPGAPKPLLRAVETLLIALLWPVYNHQKNLWNLRRIPLPTARRQAVLRAGIKWSFNCRPAHLIGWVAFLAFVYINRGVFL